MQKFIVTWVTVGLRQGKEVYRNEYKVFIDSTSTLNRINAEIEYSRVLELGNLYTANLSEILKSTDY